MKEANNAVAVRLLGRFEIEIDGEVIEDSHFERRLAGSLLKLLALNGSGMHREIVIDALWPDLTIDAASPRLHQAASYARKAVGDKRAILLRDDQVLLWPDRELTIDVEQFEIAADLAQSGSVDEAAAAVATYGGDLLPADPYEEWLGGRRDHLRLRYVDVLRTAGDWEAVLAVEPADEQAHLALMRGFVADGQRLATIRQFERLERALNNVLGVAPSDEAVALRRTVLDDSSTDEDLIDRDSERRLMQRALDDAEQGSGSLLLLSGGGGDRQDGVGGVASHQS